MYTTSPSIVSLDHWVTGLPLVLSLARLKKAVRSSYDEQYPKTIDIFHVELKPEHQRKRNP